MQETPHKRYETSIANLDADGTIHADAWWYSDTIPDCCTVAELLTPFFEITVYLDNQDENAIVEELDSDGACGNYGGFWHTTLLYPTGLPGYLRP